MKPCAERSESVSAPFLFGCFGRKTGDAHAASPPGQEEYQFLSIATLGLFSNASVGIFIPVGIQIPDIEEVFAVRKSFRTDSVSDLLTWQSIDVA